MLLHSEFANSRFRTSTLLQRMTSLIPEVLMMVIFQTFSVSEGGRVWKFLQDTQYQSAYRGGEENLIMTPPTMAPVAV